MINATDILRSIGEKQADVHYVTRSYLTRHGNGPLSREGEIDEKEDRTNRPNKHQHKLRFAPLDLNLLGESISNDLTNHGGLDITPHLKVTWANHQEHIIDSSGHNWGDNLGSEMFKLFPNMNQTRFYDKVLESGERV